jgi:ABC-type amino acid transport substrate-binding protein
MKKRGFILLVLTMLILSITACGKDTSETIKITKMEDLKDKSVGSLLWYGIIRSEKEMADLLLTQFNVEVKEVVSYDSESSLIMALDSGKVDAAWIKDFQANIFAKDSNKYDMFISQEDYLNGGSARMAAAVDTTAALDIEKINVALAQLREDGTLLELEKEYIKEFEFTKDYESIPMPKIEGAPTYKVSISGSMVPLDYISSDGNPTGYSIALLSKISELAGLNFELTIVNTGNVEMELTEGKIDYVFCYTLTDKFIVNLSELSFSDPYYLYSSTAMLVKK